MPACRYDEFAREFERVAKLLCSEPQARHAALAAELATLADAVREDCGCCADIAGGCDLRRC